MDTVLGSASPFPGPHRARTSRGRGLHAGPPGLAASRMSSLGGTFWKGLQDTASRSGGRSRRPSPSAAPPSLSVPLPQASPLPNSAEGRLKGRGPRCFVPKAASGFLRFCEALSCSGAAAAGTGGGGPPGQSCHHLLGSAGCPGLGGVGSKLDSTPPCCRCEDARLRPRGGRCRGDPAWLWRWRGQETTGQFPVPSLGGGGHHIGVPVLGLWPPFHGRGP